MSMSLSGIGVSRGVAIGKAHILERGQPEVTERSITKRQVNKEIQRFNRALTLAKEQLQSIKTRIPSTTSADISAFIDTHLLMLDDSAFTVVPTDLIQTQLCNAEWALKIQRDTLVNLFEEMDDTYLSTRKDDVVHVVNRVLRILLNQENHPNAGPASLKDTIIIADELTPADTVLLQHQGIAAFVTETGGPLSHTAIMARSLRIPAVVGLHHARRYLHRDELIIIDGQQGIILADPDDNTLNHYKKIQKEEKKYFSSLSRLKGQRAISIDGKHVTLHANIELPEDVRNVKEVGASGVGLFRTEFLFMNRAVLPDEEEQTEAYVRVVKKLKGKPITIRTLDLGADKHVEGEQYGVMPTNPALGLRAIRLCLKDPSLFIPQLRAILRTSAYGPVRLMIPMLSNIQELLQVLNLIKEAKQELSRQGIQFDENMPVGGMIEVPAAAISAQNFAKYLDFLSIGTNDLIQYTLAIDRIDDEMNYLYDPLHPAVLKLVHLIIKAGKIANIPISMCGEMAGDCRYTRLLLGLGLREFSTQPSTLLEVKNVVTKSHIDNLRKPARSILRCLHSGQALSLVDKLNEI